MKKYIKVIKLSLFYFKRGFQTLWEGLRNPDKFNQEEQLSNELIAKLFPFMVWMSMNHKSD